MRVFNIIFFSLALSAVVLGSVFSSNAGAAAVGPSTANTVCPVMPGTRVSKKFFIDYEGRRILLCCRACVKAFKKNPKKYL